MSVQFGRWNIDGKPVDQDYLETVKPLLARYGPDHEGTYVNNDIGILYHAFATSRESRRETQPYVTRSGIVLTWDGRLDNRDEILSHFPRTLSASATDAAIVAAAYQKWGVDSFGKLLGDWALSVWDANSHSLILAKDPVGTRHLYYSSRKNEITWSTTLEPLVLVARDSLPLCEEYIAGWFTLFPAVHLTPYVGIHSVAPSSFLMFRQETQMVTKYWDFDPGLRIRYKKDADYEEHFRVLFAQSVRRRLRSGGPVLAELSGGMDSASIVCMADDIITSGTADTPRLDTVSYYDDAEPNWDERPYFTRVEERRGRSGIHINAGRQDDRFGSPFDDSFPVTPNAVRGRLSNRHLQLKNSMTARGIRVVLSGIGGDEVTGGVPTPIPELQDLLAGGQFRALAHQLNAWARTKRKPWMYLLLESVAAFLPPGWSGPARRRLLPWLNPDFVKRNRRALLGYDSVARLFGPLPTFQANLNTLEVVRRQLASSPLPADPLHEKRYPYLDRSLLEFLYAIPREQLVRPGERRSLMRRALIGIVPDEVLQRKRKAFVTRAPVQTIDAEWHRIPGTTPEMVSDLIGIVDARKFIHALNGARSGDDIPLVPLMRTLGIESWLRHLKEHAHLSVAILNEKRPQAEKAHTKICPVPCSIDPKRC
jgi:asparagine synthase (glutamine-hydrolysing)